jgi:hypothetical protein
MLENSRYANLITEIKKVGKVEHYAIFQLHSATGRKFIGFPRNNLMNELAKLKDSSLFEFVRCDQLQKMRFDIDIKSGEMMPGEIQKLLKDFRMCSRDVIQQLANNAHSVITPSDRNNWRPRTEQEEKEQYNFGEQIDLEIKELGLDKLNLDEIQQYGKNLNNLQWKVDFAENIKYSDTDYKSMVDSDNESQRIVIIEYQSDLKTKISRHFIITGCCFRDGFQCFKIYESVIAAMVKIGWKEELLKKHIDPAIYTEKFDSNIDGETNYSLRSLRIPFCAKYNPSSVEKNLKLPICEHETDIRRGLISHCLQLPVFTLFIPPPPKDFELDQMNEEFLPEFKDMFQDHVYRISKRTATCIFHEFDRVKSSHCQLCNRVHDTDHTMYLRQIGDKIWQHCRRSKGKWILLTGNDEKKPVNIMPTIPADWMMESGDTLPKIDFSGNVGIYLLRGNMSIGKSELLVEYMKEKNIRALIISFRRTFSDDIGSKFTDFIDYRKIKGTISADKVIVQYESIWRIDTEKPYDLVILDEIESIFEQVSSPNVHYLSECYRQFQHLLTYGKKILGMDAYLSDRSIEMTKQIMKLREAASMDYLPFVYLCNQMPKQQLKDTYYTDKDVHIRDILADAEKFKLVIASDSKTWAESLHVKLCRLYPQKNIKFYHGESTNKDDLTNVNEHWKCDILIYTPTILAGVSFKIEWFDKLYGHFGGNSCSWLSAVQMTARIRNIGEKECNFYVGNSNTYKPETMEEIENMICDRYLYSQIDMSAIACKTTADGNRVYPYKDLYYWNTICNHVFKGQSNNHFAKYFIAARAQLGHKQFWNREQAKIKISKEFKAIQKEIKQDEFAKIEKLNLEEFQMEEIAKKENKTADEVLACKKSFIRDLYDVPQENITTGFLEKYANDKTIRRYRDMKKLICRNETIEEHGFTTRGITPDDISKNLGDWQKKIKAIGTESHEDKSIRDARLARAKIWFDICGILGLKFDGEERFTCKELEDTFLPKIGEYLEKNDEDMIRKHFGMDTRRSKFSARSRQFKLEYIESMFAHFGMRFRKELKKKTLDALYIGFEDLWQFDSAKGRYVTK